MKKLVKALFILVVGLCFIVAYNYFDNQYYSKLKLGNNDSININIRSLSKDSDYNNIEKKLRDNKLSLVIEEVSEDEIYLYLFNVTDSLVNSKDLVGYNSEEYIASYKTKSINQKKSVPDFVGNNKVRYYNYKKILSSKPIKMEGRIIGDEKTIEKFNKDLNDSGDFSSELLGSGISYQVLDRLLILAAVLLVSITFFVLLLSIILNSKYYGIKKLLGYKKSSMIYDDVLRPTGHTVLSSIGVLILLYMIYVRNINHIAIDFIIILFISLCLFALIVFLTYLIPFLYVMKFRTSLLLKEKNSSRLVYKLSKLYSIIIMLSLITISSVFVYKLNSTIVFKQKSIMKWQKIQNYVAIPYFNDIDISSISSNTYRTRELSAFNELSSKGAIYADFSEYLPFEGVLNIDGKLPMNSKDNPAVYATVNNNYLKKNNLVDDKDKTIVINDQDKFIYLLVPKKYKEHRNNAIRYLEDIYGKDKIKVITLKNNQESFTYNLSIGKSNGNNINDAILVVYNIQTADFNISSNSFGNVAMTFLMKSKDVEAVLKKHEIAKYMDSKVLIKDFISKEVYESERELTYLIIGSITLIVVLLLLIMQNIVSYILIESQAFATKFILGYKKRDVFANYLYIEAVTIVCIGVIISIIMPNEYRISNLTVCAFILMLDISVSILIFNKQTKKISLKVLKKGDD